MSDESVSEGEDVKKAKRKLGGLGQRGQGDADADMSAEHPSPSGSGSGSPDEPGHGGGESSVESMLQEFGSVGGSDVGASGSRGRTQRPGKFDLWQLSLADPHTGLANQMLLLDRLTQALARLRRHGGEVAVCHIDLDNLAEIEAEHGFMVSKDLLSEMANRLTSVLRAEDTVGRVAGSEVVVVVTVNDEQSVGPLLRRLQHRLDEPFVVGGHTIRLHASLGVAIAAGDESAEDLLARADRSTRVTKR